jgi:hypothetical protein
MDRVHAAVAEVVRAKALRLSDSAVYRISHAANNVAANEDAQSLHPAPAQGRSVRRAGLQQALAAMLGEALRSDGLSDGDAGAACDRARQHVADMRSVDGRAITLADAVLIARAAPTWRTVLVDLIGGVE